jgi:hypothetical protein
VVPQEVGLARDARSLGVALRRMAVRRGTRFQVFNADDPRLAEGFHDFEAEPGFRWTNGDATLPPTLLAGWSGPLEIVLLLGGTAHYIDDGDPARAA